MKALSVAINKYNTAPLRGCINDSEHIAFELKQYGYDVIRLHDERATKSEIIRNLEELLSNSVGKFVFHYSGHGSQVPCDNGTEDDGLTEILCPYDLIDSNGKWSNNYITDDELQQIFSKYPNVEITCLMDCCHSGSLTRELKLNSNVSRYIPSPLENVNNKTPFNISNVDNVICFSAAKDSETAADAFIDGKYQGAFTAALLTSSGNRGIVFKTIEDYMVSHGYSQHPQLSCSEKQLTENLF
jgi:uncharacterized caspase-like protein